MSRQTTDASAPQKPRKGRNRRFVISIWMQTEQEADSPLDALYGHIWEADAAAPGALADPIPFERLAAVPACLERLMKGETGGRS